MSFLKIIVYMNNLYFYNLLNRLKVYINISLFDEIVKFYVENLQKKIFIDQNYEFFYLIFINFCSKNVNLAIEHLFSKKNDDIFVNITILRVSDI